MPTIQTADEVWLIAAGPDKAAAVGAALNGTGDLPAAPGPGHREDPLAAGPRGGRLRLVRESALLDCRRAPHHSLLPPRPTSTPSTTSASAPPTVVRTPAGMYIDDRLMGDVFAAPYVTLEPEHAHVLDDGSGTAVGYVLGHGRHRDASCAATATNGCRRTADRYPTTRRSSHADRHDARPAPAPGAHDRARSWPPTPRTCTSTCCRSGRASGYGRGLMRASWPACTPPARRTVHLGMVADEHRGARLLRPARLHRDPARRPERAAGHLRSGRATRR